MTKPKLYAFWKCGQYPYFRGGEISTAADNGQVTSAKYGDGSSLFRPVLVVPASMGEYYMNKLETLCREYDKAKELLRVDFLKRLAQEIPELENLQ